MLDKTAIVFDWDKICRRLRDNIATSGEWGNKVSHNYNCQLCNGTLLLAYLRNVDLPNAKLKYQTVYDNAKAARHLGTGNVVLNIPSMDDTFPNQLFWGGDPTVCHDIYALSIAKNVLTMNIGRLPTPSAMWKNWKYEQQDWLTKGIHATCETTNLDASKFREGFAQNQMLTATAMLLLADEAQGRTEFKNTAKSVLKGWKAKFPTLAAEVDEKYYEPKKSPSYKSIKVLCLLTVIYRLHSYGDLSKNEVKTYVDWMDERVKELETVIFDNKDCWIEILASEILYAKLKGKSSIPNAYASASIEKMIDEINNNLLCGNSYPLLCFATQVWNPTRSS
jgi:hypothetical protein